ncbi:DNA photolyase class 1, 8-HDF type [Parasponia andersonii]|uniref:DNA photolyase class 1, 8-HDF type n=1 Tax=Parasponia andersonii TaxID=3476 RepID=A0A2P5C5B7_PARAD|nr:DNA photolyase class 1, 8-HDF type [Parasponia andersonii]
MAAAALFTSPHFPSLSHSPNTLRFSQSRRRHRSVIRAQIRGEKRGVAVIWFKHDLRIDDHPGLVAATSNHLALVPLYVFDNRILLRFSDEMLEMVLIALEVLRNSLRSKGSNLVIRLGTAENVIKGLVKEVNATHVYAEEEAEHDLRKLMTVAEETLETLPFPEKGPKLVLWRTPFYDIESLMDLPLSYEEFNKLRFQVSSPLPPPTLPDTSMELNWGPIPTLDELMEFIMNVNTRKRKSSWSSIKEKSAENLLMKELLKTGASNQSNSSFKNAQSFQQKRVINSVFVTREGSVVGGGTNSVLNALAAYLRYLEGTARDDWEEVHERIRNAEAREGASFIKLFGPALSLGIISRRRVHYEAIKYEKDRNAGFLSPFGYSTVSGAAAINAVCSMEWYWLMSLKCQISGDRTYGIRIWKWKGHLIQYTVAGHKGPAILLVHGFGAFLEHYRDNIYDLAEGGNQVWAITLLGFGKSEKPNVVYTELMWAELLRDFIVEVVGEPVHLVGNSIGGYFVAILACFWPTLAKSVVLVNSAGNVVPGYSFVPFTKDRQTSGAAWLGARLLVFYLRSRLKSIVKNCYPTKTDRVDDGLINEMLRASYDPGVLAVLESIFSFNLTLPLNYLLKDFEERVLVIQGMKDPISDSKSKLAMLREHCDRFVIKELDAGHCPHDELPEEVNSIIGEWIVTRESKIQVGSIALERTILCTEGQ